MRMKNTSRVGASSPRTRVSASSHAVSNSKGNGSCVSKKPASVSRRSNSGNLFPRRSHNNNTGNSARNVQQRKLERTHQAYMRFLMEQTPAAWMNYVRAYQRLSY